MVDRKLGRGLDFFLSGIRGASAGPSEGAKVQDEGSIMVELGKITPNPSQPRKAVAEAELNKLAESIRASGVLQPILVRKTADNYQIIAGERRWRAAQMAGIAKIPVVVRAVSDEDSATFAIVENLQREDLNAIEKAHAFKQLVARFHVSHEDLSRRVGLDRSTVANFIRLLDLPVEVQDHVSRGTLSMGHARAILGIEDPQLRVRLADEAVRGGISVRVLEERINTLNAKAPAGKVRKGKASRPAWVNELEENLVESIGAPVAIRYGKRRSQVIIECAGREELERIYNKLRGE